MEGIFTARFVFSQNLQSCQVIPRNHRILFTDFLVNSLLLHIFIPSCHSFLSPLQPGLASSMVNARHSKRTASGQVLLSSKQKRGSAIQLVKQKSSSIYPGWKVPFICWGRKIFCTLEKHMCNQLSFLPVLPKGPFLSAPFPSFMYGVSRTTLLRTVLFAKVLKAQYSLYKCTCCLIVLSMSKEEPLPKKCLGGACRGDTPPAPGWTACTQDAFSKRS